jgi:hypothetical protein
MVAQQLLHAVALHLLVLAVLPRIAFLTRDLCGRALRPFRSPLLVPAEREFGP